MSLRWTEEELAEWQRKRARASASAAQPVSKTDMLPVPAESEPKKRRKYGNIPTMVDGKRFDSKHEAEVYEGLVLRKRGGELWIVLRQVAFDLPGGIRYIADFVTIDHAGNLEVLDAKSATTKQNRVYINKKKQMAAEWGIAVKEV